MFSKKHYPTIVKLNNKQQKFDNIMEEYLSTYKTYIASLKNDTGEYWDIRDDIDIDRKVGKLNVGFTNHVTKEECFQACAKNKDCKYVLFNDSPRECLLFDKKSAGFTDKKKSGLVGWEKPTWDDMDNTSYFDSEFEAGTSTDSWKYLGKASTLTACKDRAVKSDKGPFASIVFADTGEFKDRCYGGVLGGKTSSNQVDGMYTSLAPGGSTGFSMNKNTSFNISVGSSPVNNIVVDLPSFGMKVSPKPVNKQNSSWSDTFKTKVEGKKLNVIRIDQDSGWGQNLVLKATAPNVAGIKNKILLDKLLFLNKMLNTLVGEIAIDIENVITNGKINKEMSMLNYVNILQKGKQLANDREKLLELTNDIESIKMKNISSKMEVEVNNYIYVALTILAISIVGYTIKQLLSVNEKK